MPNVFFICSRISSGQHLLHDVFISLGEAFRTNWLRPSDGKLVLLAEYSTGSGVVAGPASMGIVWSTFYIRDNLYEIVFVCRLQLRASAPLQTEDSNETGTGATRRSKWWSVRGGKYCTTCTISWKSDPVRSVLLLACSDCMLWAEFPTNKKSEEKIFVQKSSGMSDVSRCYHCFNTAVDCSDSRQLSQAVPGRS